MSPRPCMSLLCALGLFALAACAAADSRKTNGMIGPPPTAADLAGEWLLTGKGKFYDCTSVANNGRLEPTFRPFRVDAEVNDTPSASDAAVGAEPQAFVQRVSKDYVSLTANISDDVEFEGGGDRQGTLYFSIREMLSNGTELVYDFDGEMRDIDRADGTFTGSAPGDCSIKGTFSLRRE